MNTHEHLRRLVEAREVDSIRDRKHEFSVLAGIRPNLPSLEEAAGDLDEAAGGYALPKDVLSKIGGWTFEMPVERLFAKARKGPLSKAEVQKIVKSLKFEIQDMQRGGERDGVKKFTWLLNTMRTLKPLKEDLDDLDEALGVPALNKWKMHQKGGTTAYAITLHGKKVIVGETPSPKGSGLYRYSLYIDGAKYGKQDFTSTRDLFQTIQKAVVESAGDLDEGGKPDLNALARKLKNAGALDWITFREMSKADPMITGGDLQPLVDKKLLLKKGNKFMLSAMARRYWESVERDDRPFDEAYGDIAMVGSFKNKAGDKVAIYKGPDGYFIQGKTGAGKMIMASGFKSEKDATKWLIKKRIKTEGHDEADDLVEWRSPIPPKQVRWEHYTKVAAMLKKISGWKWKIRPASSIQYDGAYRELKKEGVLPEGGWPFVATVHDDYSPGGAKSKYERGGYGARVWEDWGNEISGFTKALQKQKILALDYYVADDPEGISFYAVTSVEPPEKTPTMHEGMPRQEYRLQGGELIEAELQSEAKRPTFKAAKAAILAHLQKEGWKVNPHLKVPHATAPDGELRLWFKTQAVYYSSGSKHTLGNARSLDMDIRTMTPEKFVKEADRLGREWGKSRHDMQARWDAHWGGMY